MPSFCYALLQSDVFPFKLRGYILYTYKFYKLLANVGAKSFLNGPLFSLFSVFSNITFFTTNQCENMSIQYPVPDSNQQPHEHESSPITTRPGLLLTFNVSIKTCFYLLLSTQCHTVTHSHRHTLQHRTSRVWTDHDAVMVEPSHSPAQSWLQPLAADATPRFLERLGLRTPGQPTHAAWRWQPCRQHFFQRQYHVREGPPAATALGHSGWPGWPRQH